MPEWELVVLVRVKADTPAEASAWVAQELTARLQPDGEGGTWHRKGQVPPHYEIASVRRVAEERPVPPRQG